MPSSFRILFRSVSKRRKAPNWSGIAKEMLRVIEAKTKPELIKYHERIVAEWKNQPGFRAVRRWEKGGVALYVYATGPHKRIWEWMVRGTGLYGPRGAKYEIKPRRRHMGGRTPVLAFPSVYHPRTKPGAGGHYKGPGTSSGPTVFAFSVMHPGIKPRKFPEAIARWYKPIFQRDMRNAIRRGARRV